MSRFLPVFRRMSTFTSRSGITQTVLTPTFPESIKDGTVCAIEHTVGTAVKVDEVIINLETDKITIAVPTPVAGTITHIYVREEDIVRAGDKLFTVRG